jgi:outer membrane scaffolding protein for murein synthesis (MipA/OmpV family)
MRLLPAFAWLLAVPAAALVAASAGAQVVDSPGMDRAAPARTQTRTAEPVAEAAPPASGSVRRSQPVWEAGIGFTALRLPDYRGAGRTRNYLLPLPYLVYRGPWLSVDRDGLRAELLDKGRLELDISVNLSVPVRSDGNPARAGMPDLRSALEIGPQLRRRLWDSADRRARLRLELPLRYAFALDSSLQDVGFVFHPQLDLSTRDLFGMAGWNGSMVVGPIFATARHHRYFYSVAPEYATAARPAYDVGSGYSGTQLTISMSKRFSRYWIGGFVRADWLAGATFADSPLVERRTSISAGLGVSWIFAESAARVMRRD